MGKIRARLQALVAAVTGVPKEARRWAAEVLEPGSGHVQGSDRLEATRALGLAALFERDAAGAAEKLRVVWEHTLREHVEDPGVLPVAADLVEALVQSGDIDSARRVTELLRRMAVEQQHPWGLASAKRCSAMVQLAGGYLDDAAELLEEAAADYAALGLHFDRARTLLYLGALQRRSQKRTAARHSLEEATAQFDRCWCSGWATRARSELAQVSGRRSANEGELTPSERQVVDLAASGLSNKGDRRPPLRDREHRRGAPFARIRQARDPLSFTTARQPGQVRPPVARSCQRATFYSCASALPAQVACPRYFPADRELLASSLTCGSTEGWLDVAT
jgi:ATP/maltotriose-dependent transcriptional regulator MalT